MDYRYIARFKIEATTPLFVGSGDTSLITDSLVQKDHLGLPMIPGTSLTGVLRHSFFNNLTNKNQKEYSEGDWDKYFGLSDFWGNQITNELEERHFAKWYKNKKGKDAKAPDGLGSRLKVSSAYFLNGKGKVAEGFEKAVNNNVFTKLEKLPTRQHVRITDKGVADDQGLFDHEVLHKGAQFIFEMELKGTEEDQPDWRFLIDQIKSPTFRVGQGTRNGFGNLKVKGFFEKSYNLENKDDFDKYLNFSPSLNSIKIEENENDKDDKPADYTLALKPDDFFIFSEGFGDAEVDNKPVTEEVMVYKNEKIDFVEKTLIPASSIKGAIAHRVAYYYNKEHKNNKNYNQGSPVYADDLESESLEKYTGENNPAVKMLFGKKGEVVNNKNIGQRGILILDDLYYDDIDNEKIFNHVAIDRFTGGGIDGALFSEKVSHLNKEDDRIEININLSKPIQDEKIEEALEETLKDICRGLLPLGGMTTKGHGMFTGKLLKGEQEIFNYESTKMEA